MSDLKLRRASLADEAQVSSVLGRSYGAVLANDYAPEVLAAALPGMSLAKPELLASGRYFVIERAGQVVCVGGWSDTLLRGAVQAGIGHIRHVACDPDHLRQGLAQRLLSHVLEDACAAEVAQMECLSTLSAQRFYEAMGFETLHRGEIALGAQGLSFPVVFMQRSL